jgi:DNA repair protein RadC
MALAKQSSMSPSHQACAIDAVQQFRKHLTNEPIEILQILFFDPGGAAIGHQVHSFGGPDQTWLSISGILNQAIALNATTLLLAHNHPNGVPTPSIADRIATERLARAAAAVGIHVLDHLVITDDCHSSVFEANGPSELKRQVMCRGWCSRPSCSPPDPHLASRSQRT